MNPLPRLHQLLIVATLLLMAQMSAGQGNIIVGDLYNLSSYGSASGMSAFSVGTTSCNLGNQPVPWVSSTNDHPVIALNMYRLKDGSMEQIGMSWLKHGFLALSGSVCTPCNGPGGSQLSPGCSDPYSASLNGSQSNLGPRGEVNASTGYFPYPPASPAYPSTIGRRIQVDNADLSPASNVNARYFVEGHYISAYDSSVNNDEDNASYREVSVSGSGSNYTISFVSGAGTERKKPAIQAWADIDPSVILSHIDLPGDGRFTVAYKITSIGGGNYRWQFSVHNLNSHDSARSLTIPVPAGASVSNVSFRGIAHHSNDGENGGTYSSANWTSSVSGSAVNWQTSTFAQDPLAHALRWSTTFSFGFDCDMAPTGIVSAAIGLYRSGGTVNVPPVMDIGQPNSPEASLRVDGAMSANNYPPSDGFNGPFFVSLAAGQDLTMNFGSNPNYVFFLLSGPLNRNNAVFPNIGSMDIGNLGSLNNYSDITILMDGANGTSFFDLLARVNGTGIQTISLPIPSQMPVGILGTFQCAMFNENNTSTLKFSAATEVSIQ